MSFLNKIRAFMHGRYGIDRLSIGLIAVGNKHLSVCIISGIHTDKPNAIEYIFMFNFACSQYDKPTSTLVLIKKRKNNVA